MAAFEGGEYGKDRTLGGGGGVRGLSIGRVSGQFPTLMTFPSQRDPNPEGTASARLYPQFSVVVCALSLVLPLHLSVVFRPLRASASVLAYCSNSMRALMRLFFRHYFRLTAALSSRHAHSTVADCSMELNASPVRRSNDFAILPVLPKAQSNCVLELLSAS